MSQDNRLQIHLGADVPIGKYDMTEVNILWVQ
ncbi:MAG: hypothetical protein BWY21_01961 [Parcubacteria group bacterium ADurb.Bin216]|nr:MAG: hypothetical protein BWY21_01961 [Parcubacteria group bacterium ADurb.Bin216]